MKIDAEARRAFEELRAGWQAMARLKERLAEEGNMNANGMVTGLETAASGLYDLLANCEVIDQKDEP